MHPHSAEKRPLLSHVLRFVQSYTAKDGEDQRLYLGINIRMKLILPPAGILIHEKDTARISIIFLDILHKTPVSYTFPKGKEVHHCGVPSKFSYCKYPTARPKAFLFRAAPEPNRLHEMPAPSFLS